MSYNFLFSSTNVRGLGSDLKRKEIFIWLHNRNFDISFLQETHSTADTEKAWQHQWGFSNSIHFSHGTSDSRGVAIVFKRGVDVIVDRTWRDRDGRCLMLEVRLQELQAVLVNLYSPNTVGEQIEFFQRMRVAITVFNQNQLPVIIGGDFNVVFDHDLDKSGGRHFPRTAVVRCIRDIQSDWELMDAWREQNPLTRQYTWQQSHPLVKCRLDYWLIPVHLLIQIAACQISRAPCTDHKSVVFRIQGPHFQSRGPGIWRLNTTVLQHEQYQEEIRSKIEAALAETSDWNAGQRWEYLKMTMRNASMQYCAKLNSIRLKRKLELQSMIDQVDVMGDAASVADLEIMARAKQELEVLLEDDARRAILRSKVRWLAYGEKPNKYFLGLEKRNSIRKCILKLVTAGGEEITDSKRILQAAQEHFNQVYTRQSVSPQARMTWFDQLAGHDPHGLGDAARDQLDRPLEEWEYSNATKQMASGKAPGRDGLPAEWYRTFWRNIQEPFLASVNESIVSGELTPSQKQGVITLLPKPGKDTTQLSNWRPITLLNCDYKILAKALATRLKPYLSNVINVNQSGFMAGRYIGENIRLAIDIIEFLHASRNETGLLLSLDFEKAFDSIDWEFMFLALERKNFGPSFISMVKLLYQGSNSEIVNNGHVSGRIPLGRGIRQGCPLSPYLFIIAIDYLATALTNHPEVRGVQIRGNEYLISQYADDTTLFLEGTRAAEAALEVLDEFGQVSGLKLNKAKTQCLGMGPLPSAVAGPAGIHMVQEVKILGITFAYDSLVMLDRNFNDKLVRLQKTMEDWSHRHLTLFGKVLVWNQLLGSQLVYSLMNVPVPETVWKNLKVTIRKFLWDGHPPKVRHEVMIQPVCAGGVKAPDIPTTMIGLRLSWLKRLLRNPSAPWTKIGFQALDAVGGLPFLLQCNFDLQLLGVHLPQFYAAILDVYRWARPSPICEVNSCDVLAMQLVCNNRFVLIGGRSIYYEWLREGPLSYVTSWFDGEGRPRPWRELAELTSGRLTHFLYIQVVSAIPRAWRQMIAVGVGAPSLLAPQPDMVKGAKKRYIVSRRGTPAGQLRWCVLYPGVVTWSWSSIWRLPAELGVLNKIRILQFKLLHRILASPSKLHLWGKRDSGECYACGAEMDTIDHMLALCPWSRRIWSDIFQWFEREEEVTINWTTEQILFGIVQTVHSAPVTRHLNTIILLAKYYLYSQRKSESFVISAVGFSFVLKRYLLQQWHVSLAIGKQVYFEELWQRYL